MRKVRANVRATGVISRFLSLLDVVLILLGVFLVTLMQTQLRASGKQAQRGSDGSAVSAAALAGIDFVYLYAGWKGGQNGRCYLLDADKSIGREIRTDDGSDIQELLTSRKNQNDKVNQVVLLLFAEDGWYAAWDAKRLDSLEQVWKIKIVPVYNVRLSR